MEPLKVLFLCSGNSARSIFGECLMRHFGKGHFETYSAGSSPRGIVNPYTIRVLQEVYQIDTTGARSKPIDEVRNIPFDFVITVCDHARESCPVWPKHTVVAHWSSPDPAEFVGSEEETFRRFELVAGQIRRRVELMCALPLSELNKDRQERLSREIGDKEKLATSS